MSGKLVVAGFVLLVIAFLLDIGFSYGTMYWLYRDFTTGSTNIKYYQGLWRQCIKLDNSGTVTDTCYWVSDDNFSLDKMYLGNCQVLQSVGVATLFYAITCLILKLAVNSMKTSGAPVPMSAAFTLLGSICLMLSGGIFAYGVDDTSGTSTSYLHFSMICGSTSGFIALIAAIILIIAAVVEPKSKVAAAVV